MMWKQQALRFGIRFVICLVMLGVGYLLLFGPLRTSHNRPPAPSQKLATIRASLAETYLAGSNLAEYDRTSADAYFVLGELESQFNQAHTKLQTALKDGQSQLEANTLAKLGSVIDRQEQVKQGYQARFDVLGKAITYDPEADLSRLDLNKQAELVAERSAAAARGINKAAEDSTVAAIADSLAVHPAGETPRLISNTTKQALAKEANCFAKLQQQMEASQMEPARQTRDQCIRDYATVRKEAIVELTRPSFGEHYKQFADREIPSLLRQLDRQIQNINGQPFNGAQKPSK